MRTEVKSTVLASFPGQISEGIHAVVRGHQSRNMAMVINASQQKLEDMHWQALVVRVGLFLWNSSKSSSRQPVASWLREASGLSGCSTEETHSLFYQRGMRDFWKDEVTVRRKVPSHCFYSV